MSKNLKIIIAIVTAIPVIGMFIGIVYPELFFSTQEATKNWLQSFGIIAPIVFVLLQIVQVIFPPISHYTVGILGGFIYGPWLGGFLNWLGRVIGHSIAFYLSRTFARKWVKKFISESELNIFKRRLNLIYQNNYLLKTENIKTKFNINLKIPL